MKGSSGSPRTGAMKAFASSSQVVAHTRSKGRASSAGPWIRVEPHPQRLHGLARQTPLSQPAPLGGLPSEASAGGASDSPRAGGAASQHTD